MIRDAIDHYHKINEKGKLLYIQHKDIGDIRYVNAEIPYPRYPCVGIKFPASEKLNVERALMAYELVAGELYINVYKVDGKCIFPIMNRDGKWTDEIIVYLFMIDEGEGL